MNRFEGLTSEETKSLGKALQEVYILPVRQWIFSVIGGALAVLVCAGMVSWQATRKALEDNRAEKAFKAAEDAARQAETAKAKAITSTDEIDKRLNQMDDKLFDPPVGTVLAFAGSWPPRDSSGSQVSEDEIGWMLCDGRPMMRGSHEGLWRAIGRAHGNGQLDPTNNPEKPEPSNGDFNLPDYRGYFLRGVDVTRLVDSDTREYKLNGTGEAGKPGLFNGVGTRQSWATAQPRNKLIMSENEDILQGAYGVQLTGAETVHEKTDSSSGEINIRNGIELKHTHTITGGDKETRPVNSAVNWIIRIRAEADGHPGSTR